MSLLATMFNLTPFVPPQGVLMTYGEKPMSKASELRESILDLVESGVQLDTDIAKRVSRSDGCVRTYLLALCDEGLIKKVDLTPPDKMRGQYKPRYFPIDAVVDVEQLLKEQPRRYRGGNVAVMQEARLRGVSKLYRLAMEGLGWLETGKVGERIGKSRQAAHKTLMRMHKDGIIERRLAGSRIQHGYEWMMK